MFLRRLNLFILVFAICGMSLAPASELKARELEAVEGWVYGNVQQVGFRAFIFKQAIRYNLGGSIDNQPDGSVHFILQGHPNRIEEALALIRKGPAKANVTDVKENAISVRQDINSVTVKGWTSKSRNFDHPVDLVYPLRSDDGVLSPAEASGIFKKILREAMASAETPAGRPGS